MYTSSIFHTLLHTLNKTWYVGTISAVLAKGVQDFICCFLVEVQHMVNPLSPQG
jgi:hypothetical protein